MNIDYKTTNIAIETINKLSKKHVIFDFDKTVACLFYDWKQYKLDVWKILEDLDPTLIPENKGSYAIPVINKAVLKHGWKAKKTFDEFQKNFESKPLRNYEPNEVLVKYIKDTCKEMDFYIWSNNHYDTIVPILEAQNIDGCFKKIISKDKSYINKPYPDGFFDIFDNTMHIRDEFILIGDNDSSDGGAARRVGIGYYILKFIEY